MMKTLNFVLIVTIAILGGVAGCADLKQDLPAPTSSSLRVHPPGWNDSLNTAFHGKFLKGRNWSLNDCTTCHSKTYQGGVSGVSCFTCHTSYPHTRGWNDTSTTNFHGQVLKRRDWMMGDCSGCHGATFEGGSSGVSCRQCHSTFPHMAGWLDTSRTNFHGKVLKTDNWNLGSCAKCHASDFRGGRVGVGCFSCHSSYPHTVFGSNHPGYLMQANYPLSGCKTCHGSDYRGGARVNVSCASSGCHVDQSGNAKSPEACNTCHGDFRSPDNLVASFAPPTSLFGDTARTVARVGTHQDHLRLNVFAAAVNCNECHSVPSALQSSGHLGTDFRAEVLFAGTVGRSVTNEPTTIFYDPTLPQFIPSPSYSPSTNRCSNTYCHGYFKNGNTTFSPVWNDPSGAQVACGTCHGDVTRPTLAERAKPRGTHPNSTQCSVCHYKVTSGDLIDANLNIVDKTKHIDGRLNLFGVERDF